jgi:HAUS augmin-like complex subunit 1
MDSPLISPSKARQAASQAKDWAYITSWLNRKYAPNPVPPFERNDDTLKTLLALAAANDSADEEEALLQRAREEILRALKAQEKTGGHHLELLYDIESNLDDKGSKMLQDLSETAVMLGTVTPDVRELGQAILDLTLQEFDAAEQMRKIEALQTYLEKELDALRLQLEQFRIDNMYETPTELPVKITEWIRGTKLLGAKVEEYQDRISALERSGIIQGPRIEELMVEEESVVRLRETVKVLEGRVKMFHGLPPNVHDAKEEYKRLDREFQTLVRKRDGMFENLVDHAQRSV